VVVAVVGYGLYGAEVIKLLGDLVTLAYDVDQADYFKNGKNRIGENDVICQKGDELANLLVNFAGLVPGAHLVNKFNKVTGALNNLKGWLAPLRNAAGKYADKVKNKSSAWYLKIQIQIARATGKLDELIQKYAIQATNNPNSSKIVLGKTNEGGVGYIQVAKDKNATYFNLDNWDHLAKNMTRDEMWEINKTFLIQQLAKGKEILFSHNPNTATGAFLREVEFLKKRGFSFKKIDGTWKAVKL